MKQLLDLTRLADYYPAYTFLDEKQQSVVNVDEDLAKSQFERFMQVREEVRIHKQEVQGRLIAIGYALLQIKNDELYHYVTDTKGTYGYSSFYAFVKDVFGCGKTFACSLINVAREFCEKDGIVKLGYGRYSFTQLESMLTVDEKYRERIPVKCSSRDIKHLGKLYETNPPKEDTTVEEDLELWRKLHKEEQARKNAKKNAIVFVPARKSDNTVQAPERSKNLPTQGEISFPGGENPPAESENGSIADDFDGEDERDIITPEEKKIPYEAIRDGLYRQLELLRECFSKGGEGVYEKWSTFCTYIETALRNRFPDYIVPYNSFKEDSEDKICFGKPASGKLSLKGKKACKEWLWSYSQWGPPWLDLPYEKVYRYDFVNGDSLLVRLTKSYSPNPLTEDKSIERCSVISFGLISKLYPEPNFGFEEKFILEWLTKNAKEI